MASSVLDLLPRAKQADPDKVLRIARARVYPGQVWALIGGFIGFLAVVHVLGLVRRAVPSRYLFQSSSGPFRLVFRPLAVTVGLVRIAAFRCTVNVGGAYTINLAEVFLTLAYVTVLLSWTLARSVNLEGDLDPKYWANIAGHLAASQLPLVAALGTRMNIIATLVGASFDKLSFLHRMSARVVCVIIWLHAAGRIHLGLLGTVAPTVPWVRCGILAASTLTVLCLVSVRPIRSRNYEIFVVVHFVLVLVILVGAYFHADGLGYRRFVYPAFILWALDRVYRAARFVYHNFHALTRSDYADSSLELIADDYVRLRCKLPRFTWAPGQSVFLTIPKISCQPLENHPFTISTIAPTRLLADIDAENGVKPEEVLEQKELTFLIKVKGGFTRRLRDTTADINSGRYKVFVDGPYTRPPVLRGYRTLVFIAGGSGVSFTLPLFQDAIRQANRSHNDLRNILFVWVLRNPDHMRVAAEQLTLACRSSRPELQIDVQIFLTHGTPITGDSGSELEKDELATPSSDKEFFAGAVPGASIKSGRPDLTRLLEDCILNTGGSASVNVCGPRSMSNDIRRTLRSWPFVRSLWKGESSVTLHVEAFGSA